MSKTYFGKSLLRNEDHQLLTGEGLFVDDIELPDMLHIAFHRSGYAHANILSIDTAAARKLPGVVAVYTAEDAPVLGDGVEVGAGAVVIGKVTIGDGAMIGPNAVVMSDVPAGMTAFSAPARVVDVKRKAAS